MKYQYLLNKAKNFIRHAFRNQVLINAGIPRVLISRPAYNDMYVLVDEVSDEVGWVGVVEKIGRDYLIKEIFLLEQESHAATCEISAEGIVNWATEMMSSRPDGVDVVNSLRFWGHSHVNMGVSPSTQDDDQMKVFAESCNDYFIRGILNKNGVMEFTLYLYEAGIEIHDVEWDIYEPTSDERRAHWKAEIAKKVTKRIYYARPGRNYAPGLPHRYDEFEFGGDEVGEVPGLQIGNHLPSLPNNNRWRSKK